jgi:hypothetical protein
MKYPDNSLCFFIGPSLLHLIVQSPLSSALLAKILQTTIQVDARLKSLELTKVTLNNVDGMTIESAIRRFSSIRKLAIPKNLAELLGIDHLGSLPYLSNLSVGEGMTKPQRNCLWSGSKASFQSLDTICGGSWLVTPVLTAIVCPEMVYTITLQLSPSDGSLMNVIRHLYGCSSLKNLTIVFALEHFNPGDTDYEEISQQWPQMTKFCMNTNDYDWEGDYHVNGTVRPNATLNSLLRLSTSWKSLQKVAIPLDVSAHVEEENPNEQPLMRTDSVLYIEIDRWVGIKGAEERVKGVLKRLLLPGCSWRLKVSGLWGLTYLLQIWCDIFTEIEALRVVCPVMH